MTNEIKQIIFKASKEQKKEWEEEAEEQGFKSFSDFIRTTLTKELAQSSQTDTGASDDVSAQLSELTQTVNKIATQVDDVDSRLDSIEREVRDDPEVKELASDVFRILPTKNEAIESAKGTPSSTDSVGGTVEQIANRLDRKPYEIEQAIERLQKDTHRVHSMTASVELGGIIQGREEQSDALRYYKDR